MKKAIHHFNRGMVFGLEVIGFGLMLAFLLWCALMWRLTQGPIDIGFLTTRLEQSMEERHPGFDFGVARTELSWGGNFQPLEIQLRDVSVNRADGTAVLAIEKMGVQLSKRYMLTGRLMPRRIKIYGPAFRIIRWEDGHFSLNLDGAPAAVYGPPVSPAVSAEKNAANLVLIRSVLEELRQKTGSVALLGGLREISIYDAHVTYEDKALMLEHSASEASLEIKRSDNGLKASLKTAVAISADYRAAVEAGLFYGWNSGATRVTLAFSGIDPSLLAAQSEKLAMLSGVHLPLRGGIGMTLDSDFKPGDMHFLLGSDGGTFSGFGMYEDTPLKMDRLYLKGHLAFADKKLVVEKVQVGIGGPAVDGSARVDWSGGTYQAEAEAVLVNMPVDDVKHYWPATLTPDPRWWVTEHLSAGMARRGTIKAALTYDPAAEKKISITSLGGEIYFDGVKVDYFPPLMPVLNVKGKATFDADRFHLDLDGGTLGDMTVKKSVIDITGLAYKEKKHALIDIQTAVSGSMKTALSVLDSKPLEYPKMLGIKSADVGGRAEADLRFKFPIHEKLDIAEVDVEAKAKLHDVLLKNMVAGKDISGGPMDLTVNNGALRVKGTGKLGDVPLTFDWSKNFVKKTPFDNRVTASLPLSMATLQSFGVPDVAGMTGTMAADVVYEQQHNGNATLDLKGDIRDLALVQADIGLNKPVGAGGHLSLRVDLAEGAPRAVKALAIDVPGLLAARGDVALAQTAGKTSLQKITLSSLSFGQTQVAVEAENRGPGGYAVRVSGKQLDVSTLFDSDEKPNTDAAAAVRTTPIRLSMNVDRLVLGEGRVLDAVKLFLHRNEWQRIEQLETDGTVGGRSLYLRYMPVSGGHSLQFEAENAGAALSLLGLTRAVRGGQLTVKGEPAPKSGARDLRGTVVLSDFILKDAPTVATLLNAMSLGGILDLLNGQGIAFKRARVNFSWTDRGQPEQQKNIRLIRLKDGRTSGASLGLTFEGDIDNWTRTLDLEGTIIPMSGVNNLLSGIPLVGDILTGGGEGILAATYKIRGPQSKANVSVNPLSVLAPGILRNILFEN